ncbi:DUF6973 domain-containing protein [Rhodococcus sp. NPDC058505]|uniref:DUF6973 domain-containing protein n=1 Tax=Rhodococcus sp. NPDC058505 TaxID=3346531 RepID=UPI003668F16C
MATLAMSGGGVVLAQPTTTATPPSSTTTPPAAAAATTTSAPATQPASQECVEGTPQQGITTTSPLTTSATATPPAPLVCSEGTHQQASATTSSPSAATTSTAAPRTSAAPPAAQEKSAAPATTPSAAEQARPGNGKKTPYTGEATENPNAKITPGQMRSDREEIPEGFTKADADKAETMEAALVQKQASPGVSLLVAPGCQVYWPAPYEVCGAIKDKYNSLGGPTSFLLLPTTNELTNPDGHGKRTQFQNGPIYWSAATGAHPVVNHFHQKWGEYGYEGGWLGYPKTDEVVLNGGRNQDFQGATIYWSPPTGAHPVGGAIRDKWAQTGWEGGFLGYPVSDEIWVGANGQGRMNRFQNGVIYWSSTTGAYPVTGAILEQWSRAGYEQSSYGYPTADQANPSGLSLEQQFQNGKIYVAAINIPIGSTGAMLSLGIPSVGPLQVSGIPNGIAVNGPGFETKFVRTYANAVNVDLVRTNAQGPTQFSILAGLPGGYSLQSSNGNLLVKNSAGQTVTGIGGPMGFNNSQQNVESTLTLVGNLLTFSQAPSSTFPVTSYFRAIGSPTGLADSKNTYDTEMSDAERAACRDMLYWNCFRMRNSYPQATSQSEDDFPGMVTLDTKLDAHRHCMWLAYMVESGSETPARNMAEAHEEGAENPVLAKAMDLYNNETGIAVGLRNEGDSGSIRGECLGYAQQARFVTTVGEIGVNVNENDLVYYRQ